MENLKIGDMVYLRDNFNRIMTIIGEDERGILCEWDVIELNEDLEFYRKQDYFRETDLIRVPCPVFSNQSADDMRQEIRKEKLDLSKFECEVINKIKESYKEKVDMKTFRKYVKEDYKAYKEKFPSDPSPLKHLLGSDDILKVGDVVKLKSGGPLMTVISQEKHGFLCIWFVDSSSEYRTAFFNTETLVKVQK